MFTSMRCISRHEKTRVYGAILSKDLTNQAMLESKSYKTYYAFAFGEKTPKPNKKDFHISHTSGSGNEVDTQLNVLDEKQQKTSSTDEGTEDDDEDDFEDDADNNDDDNNKSDDKRTKSNRDEILYPNKTNEEHDKEEEEYDDEFNIEEDKKMYEEENDEHEEEDDHVTLTPILDTQNTGGPTQSSSVSSDFTGMLLNLDNPCQTDNEIASLLDTIAHHATLIPEITSSFTTTTPPPPLLFNPLSFSNLEKDLSEMKQVDQYAKTLSFIPTTMNRYIDNKLGEAISKAIQAHNFDCREEAQAEKREYIELVDSMKNVTDSLEAIVLTRSSSQLQSSYEAATTLSEGVEMTKTKIETPSLDQTEGQKEGNQVKMLSLPEIQDEPSHTVKDLGIQQDQEFITGDNDEQPVDKETWISQVARAEEPPTSFDKLNDTSFDFYAFVMNRLKIPNLTQEILVGPAFNLLKGTCKSITELEYHCEECSKATTEHQYRRKGLMHADELHKFSDGTLNDVWYALHDIAMGIRMEYMPMRKWSNLDKKKARAMV
nr:hypothetical protein [Tanacetum cinerariifolium]